jgi:hypothetical protein
MLIAGIIAAASLVALLPLFVSYCGTALSSARSEPLSERVSTLIGSRDGELAAQDFERVLQLVRLCPEHEPDRAGVRAVTIYYRALQAGGRLCGRLSPSFADWTKRECGDCTHFAAVVLGRCISSSHSLFTQQVSDHL